MILKIILVIGLALMLMLGFTLLILVIPDLAEDARYHLKKNDYKSLTKDLLFLILSIVALLFAIVFIAAVITTPNLLKEVF